MSTMQALVLSEWGGALELVERPVPEPRAGEVLLRVTACGVGYTLGNVRVGRMATTPGAGVPRILGNEVAGEIVALGEGVGDLARGQRGLVYMYLICGTCPACRWGHDPLCQRLRGYAGVAIDGGMAEYMVVPAINFLPLVDAVSDVDGCVIADAIATPWHALQRVAPLTPTETLVVVGAGGGVGIHAVIIGRLRGARVVAIDISDEKLEFARMHGADATVDGRASDVRDAVLNATDGRGADIVLDYVANDRTLHEAFAYLAPRGWLVVQGVNPIGTRLHIEPREFIHREAVVTGSRHASRHEVLEAAELVARGVLRPAVTRTVPLERTEELFEAMERREQLGRAAIVFDGAR